MPVALETPSLRDLVRRLRIPALALAAVVVAALLLGGPGRTLAAAFDRVLSADPAWALAAAGFEMLSFAGYIALTRHVTGLTWGDSYRTTLAGAAATRLLPTAGAGGAALTLWVLKRRGRSPADLLTFLVVLYAVFLAALLGGEPRRRPGHPRRGRRRRHARRRRSSPSSPRASARAGALLRRPHPRLLGAPAWWIFDCAVLWAAFHAVGAPPAVVDARDGLLPRPGRQHHPAPRRGLQRHDRRLHRPRRRRPSSRSPPSPPTAPSRSGSPPRSAPTP